MELEQRRIYEAIRVLLLPIEIGIEPRAIDALIDFAETKGIESPDLASTLEFESLVWKETNTPSTLLKSLVKAAIEADEKEISKKISAKYFQLHNKFQGDDYLLNFSQASSLLSHTRFIVQLCSQNCMTASQIAELFKSKGDYTTYNRQTILLLMQGLGLKRVVTAAQVEDLFIKEQSESQLIFADATLEQCAEMIGHTAERMSLEVDIAGWLKVLAPSDELSRYTPYLQMLHYQCTICEFHDFAARDLYEFAPRGEAANRLFGLYPNSMAGAKNPFLNNAKSVEELIPGWVRSKKGKEPAGAAALYGLLDHLQNLGFAAKRELSFWIRIWIHRILNLAGTVVVALPNALTLKQSNSIALRVAAENTATSGVVEQRFVDAAAISLFPDRRLWKERGLGDSVNATNVSRKKLGDCEFQNSTEHAVIAYEPHGGKLTPIYLKEHLHSLKKVLIHRRNEWATFSDPSDWSVKVYFVAHEIAGNVGIINEIFEDVRIQISAITFTDLFNQVDPEDLRKNQETYVLKVLSESRVPDKTREFVRGLI